MSDSFLDLHNHVVQSTGLLLESLSKTLYTPQEGTEISTKEILESLLLVKTSQGNTEITHRQLYSSIRDFCLACALLFSSQSSKNELLSWIPTSLLVIAESAMHNLSRQYVRCFGESNANKIREYGVESCLLDEEKRLVVELLPEVLPLLKENIKQSAIDTNDEVDEVSAASARVPGGYAVLSAHQFRWFVTQVDYPHLGKLCNLVIPCALTAVDHWSPEVKGQGMISFIHLAKNVNVVDFSCFQDVILDACCQNIAASDNIWPHIVEMSVLFATSILKSNPRNSWFEKILNEMLSHLERQPRNKERRIAWLKYVEPLLNAVGLVLLAHFRRIFPLFFQWMHADDDETVRLVLKQTQTVIKLTWIRNSPYIERLVNKLVVVYKEAALRTDREEIRAETLQLLILLQKCKGLQFEAAWGKHHEDPNLSGLCSFLSSGTNLPVETN